MAVPLKPRRESTDSFDGGTLRSSAAAVPASDNVLMNATIGLAVLAAVGLPLSLILLNLIFTQETSITINVLWRFKWTLPALSVQLVSMSVLAGIWGAAGGIISSMLVEEKRSGSRRRSHMAWLVRPLRGAFVATVIFMMIQAGLLASSNPDAAGSPLEISARSLYFVLALSAMAGFKEDVFLEKVSQIVLAVLGSTPQADDEGNEGAGKNQPSGT